jgi:hypothetical protein
MKADLLATPTSRLQKQALSDDRTTKKKNQEHNHDKQGRSTMRMENFYQNF